jgi:hypothetical protein
MRAWRRLPSALSVIAVIAAGAVVSLAQNAPSDTGSLSDIIPADLKQTLEGVASGVVINEGIRAVDEAAQMADQAPATLQSPACAAFQGLTSDAQINARLAAIRAWLDTAQHEEAAANAAERAAQNEEGDLADKANTLLSQADHAAALQALAAGRSRLAAAKTRYWNAQRMLADAQAASRQAKPCANAARALLPQVQQQASAAPSAGSSPTAGPFNVTGKIDGTVQFLCVAVRGIPGNNEQWEGTFTAQANGAGSFYGPITWIQAPAGSSAPQLQWTFAVQANGDVNDPNNVFGAMTGHIDPATRDGGGQFAHGPTPLYPRSVTCMGSWTTSP